MGILSSFLSIVVLVCIKKFLFSILHFPKNLWLKLSGWQPLIWTLSHPIKTLMIIKTRKQRWTFFKMRIRTNLIVSKNLHKGSILHPQFQFHNTRTQGIHHPENQEASLLWHWHNLWNGQVLFPLLAFGASGPKTIMSPKLLRRGPKWKWRRELVIHTVFTDLHYQPSIPSCFVSADPNSLQQKIIGENVCICTEYKRAFFLSLSSE